MQPKTSTGPNQSQEVRARHYISPLLRAFPVVVGCDPACRYLPCRVIGRGAYSTVWSLQENGAAGKLVVGKLCNLTLLSDANRLYATNEALTMRVCDHPNIIQLFEYYEGHNTILHILEYADAGDLLSQVERRAKDGQPTPNSPVVNGTSKAHTSRHPSARNPDATSAASGPCYYQEQEVLMILAQLSLAVKHLHDRHIMHRDLKTANVMLMRNGLIKLGDFGFSRREEDSVSAKAVTRICGTPFYLAPELWRRQQCDKKADIWSLGVILYELIALAKPFPDSNIVELMHHVLQEDSYDYSPLKRYSAELQDLVHGMLRVNPVERPSIQEILFSPLMQRTGLELLKVNIQRLHSVDPTTAQTIVNEVEALQKAYQDTTGETVVT